MRGPFAAGAVCVLALVVTAIALPDGQPVGDDPLPLGTPVFAEVPVDGSRSRDARPATVDVDDDWLEATARASGIPVVALRAYGRAVLVVDSSCNLGWNTLAAIGFIESGHGEGQGAKLLPDGRSTAPIIGPALDGSAGTAAIAANAESTALHGDPTWEHAVGPLQFLPSTWDRWGQDADRDGRSDPFDIDDSALAAAEYLCAGSRDLTQPDAWRAAVFSYNHSTEYVDAVLAAAHEYASAASR